LKISVIYHSQSGNTRKVGEVIALGAKLSDRIDVKVMSIDEIDEVHVRDSRAVIFGTPTICGSLSWQIKQWLDTTNVDLEGKIGSVFATENYLGGGADLAEMAVVSCLLVRGMLVYSAGFTKDGPITHFGAVTIRDGDDWQKARASFLGKRVAEKAWQLFKNE
jgi:NAD(P)H dehydrogenase (quinone)